MGLQKQAKILTKAQIDSIGQDLRSKRNGLRNQVIFLLSTKAGLRAKEIAELKWIYLLDSSNQIDDYLRLPDIASKGSSGREIPLHKDLKKTLRELLGYRSCITNFDPRNEHVVRTERSKRTSAQVIVNLFQTIYARYGLSGCSSHSGRRTFITECSRKIGTVGGSLRDVQYLAGHTSLQTTQRYIEGSTESKKKVIGLI